ncbi:MAG TPA: hypothetical protein VFD12_00260, partial [Oligella sp.]|nr:hypothetical protein [Oligella sp.]
QPQHSAASRTQARRLTTFAPIPPSLRPRGTWREAIHLANPSRLPMLLPVGYRRIIQQPKEKG